MKQSPRKYVVTTMRGPTGIGQSRPHLFRLILEWEPTPKLDEVYANIDNTYCDERCEDVARKEAEELSATIKALFETKYKVCDECYGKTERTREDLLKKERK